MKPNSILFRAILQKHKYVCSSVLRKREEFKNEQEGSELKNEEQGNGLTAWKSLKPPVNWRYIACNLCL